MLPTLNKNYFTLLYFTLTLCDKICQWFSPGTPVSSTNKTYCHDITEILLKVTVSTITLTLLSSLCVHWEFAFQSLLQKSRGKYNGNKN